MAVIDVTPCHAALLAEIHAAAFPPGERWDAAAMAGLLAMPGAFGLLDDRGGFVLARAAGGEAELLTVAVAPPVRRHGVGRALVAGVLDRLGGPVFLEVAADNQAARGLYGDAGFVACGRRQDYYGPGRDALVLRHGAPSPGR